MALNPRQLHFSGDEEASQENRKCLGILDGNMRNQSRLVVTSSGSLKLHMSSRGKKRKSDENSDIAKAKRKNRIYEDPLPAVKKQKTFVTVCVQTDDLHNSTIVPDKLKPALSVTDLADSASQVDKTINMLTSDTAPPEYWEGLAEKRRVALEKTLIENHELHEENGNLRQEVVELKKENTLLEEMVDQAKDLALLVESLTGEIESGEHKPADREKEQV